jgi:hypothetical protein
MDRQQPRALLLASSKTYRASMHLEQQKFGDASRAIQLGLWGEGAASLAGQEVGLPLTVSQAKAVQAIQILLDGKDYLGSYQEKGHYPDWKYEGWLPVLDVSVQEYLGAYGVSHGGKQTEEALEAVRSLSSTQFTIIYQKSEGPKPVRVWYRASLLWLQELGQDENIQTPDRLLITCGPLFIEQIKSFYTKKPVKMHSEIQGHLGKKRPAASTVRFIDWLLTLNLPELEVYRDKLIEILRLDYYKRERKPRELQARIQEALDTALALEYLLEARDDGTGKYALKLNPKRMGRKPRGRTDEENRFACPRGG